jgi:uncharacterized Zn finger protein (UPF0148 family)
MLCKLGCGLPGMFQRKNGNYYCADHNSKCPVVKKQIGERNAISKLGKSNSKESNLKRAESLKGRPVSEETREKIKNSNKEYWDGKVRIPWNKGLKGSQIPWNKGLRKTEISEILDRADPIYSNFKKYRNRVATRTKKNYQLYESIINPNNLKLGKCGIDGANQIDHIITVRQGFEQGIPVEVIAAAENLRVIPWLENVQKYDGKGIRKNSRLDLQ